jgi:aminomethyltransferase
MAFGITPSARLRPSPFYEATLADGVTAFTTYNQMLMPTSFGHPEQEYWRLINGVSQWDVACERQVELKGRDAGKLAQLLCPRDLTKCKVGQGKYVALCNHSGILINDPIVLKLDEERYWLSIADSNIWFWASAIAHERGLQVEVGEPDASPLAVQGPNAEAVVAAIAGDWVRSLRYFWFKETRIGRIPVLIARSGWSKQGGFEIYLLDGSQGTTLWNIVKEAGRCFGIGPGTPNFCERVESGLLSYGGDTDSRTNPFEVRLDRYIDLEVADDVVGIQSLRQIHTAGPSRRQLGVILEGSEPTELGFLWHPIYSQGRQIGNLTNCVWSWRLKRNIGFALIESSSRPGDTVDVLKAGAKLSGTLTMLPFL